MENTEQLAGEVVPGKVTPADIAATDIAPTESMSAEIVSGESVATEVRGLSLRASAPLFAALGDETRLSIVERLASGAPRSISALTAGTGVTRQAVTKHLHVLGSAGLVRSLRQGRECLWEIEPSALAAARRALDLVSERWDPALARLAAAVEAASNSSR